MKSIHYTKNDIFKRTLIAAVVSVAIGVLFLRIGSTSWNIPFIHYLQNAGYSLNLGLALFANGLIFNAIEKRYISWNKYPIKSLAIALSFHIAYSTLVIFFTNWLWFIVIYGRHWAEFIPYGKYIIMGEYFILFLIAAILYAKSFFKDWREELIQGEKLKQEAIALQYQVMQNQVNPHFLFNSLNALGSLIDIDPEKAKVFTRELSMFYRELLYFKDKELVPLSEELRFIRKYIYLQKIRFVDNFNVEINIPNENGFEVIPMSLQMLIENAIKHNIISKEKPLTIVIGQTEEKELFVSNNLQPRENVTGSNNIGLKNLTERYRFLTNRELIITRDRKSFTVTIPLITFDQDHENINR